MLYKLTCFALPIKWVCSIDKYHAHLAFMAACPKQGPVIIYEGLKMRFGKNLVCVVCHISCLFYGLSIFYVQNDGVNDSHAGPCPVTQIQIRHVLYVCTYVIIFHVYAQYIFFFLEIYRSAQKLAS